LGLPDEELQPIRIIATNATTAKLARMVVRTERSCFVSFFVDITDRFGKYRFPGLMNKGQKI
jgi:hypothetical protein